MGQNDILNQLMTKHEALTKDQVVSIGIFVCTECILCSPAPKRKHLLPCEVTNKMMFAARVQPNYPVTTNQPHNEVVKKKNMANPMFSLSIANAHEFAPHSLLQKLNSHDLLLVKEDSSNKYEVFSRSGVLLFVASRDSSHSYIVHICDPSGEEVIQLSTACCCLCYWGCCQELKVFSPVENLIGVVSESPSSFVRPSYRIIDATLPEAPLYEIRGPYCTWSCFCNDVDFPVFETRQSRHGNPQVGLISKKWGGIVRELLTDWDTFGVTFPKDMDVKHKALFLAACFLIDKKHFGNPAYP